MKTLVYCPDLGRANIIKSRLESEGITAAVVNENTSTISLCPVLEKEGIRILVDEADYELAAQIVNEVYARAVRCPKCHGRHTSLADSSNTNPLMETVLRIFYGAREKYYCHDCQGIFYKKI